MSLLGQIYATPSRVKGVVQLFTRERGQRLKRQSAEELLSPDSLLRGGDEGGSSDRRAMVKATIDECLRLRLLLADGDVLSLNPTLPDAVRRYETVGEALPQVVLDQVLDPSSDENQDLAAVLAWYLSQDAYSAPATWAEMGEAIEQQGMKEVFRFNDNRYQMFTYWAPYLGLANILAIPVSSNSFDKRLAPDPTVCLRRIVAELPFASAERVPARDFIQKVSARCPLFEGGTVRDSMETSRESGSKFLSSTTSHALLRLEEEGVLRLEMRSDADALLVEDGERPRPVSGIIRVDVSTEAA